ncbi:MAG TPA: protein kinase [Pyrinomonadaceae bacterium]|nr:protein kinase [Pyrinomonadaceae bacterium]
MIGTIVGNYKITEKIGEGGMGTVYKGVDMMLEREVAIKALRPELGSQPAVVERFRSEAVTLAKLNHPNIATLYSFFRQGDHFFMVLEFVRGATLDRIINVQGAMSCEQAITMFSQVLEGIDHAHRFGVVHRDIKPGNVMLTDTGTLKVLDFGIARVLGTARMTKAGHLIGTIEYMSPEQVRGQETDARSDIYSLGILLYEMLTGRVPFATDSEFELMKSQVEAIPPPPRDFAPHIPDAIEEVLLKSLAKRPEDRFQMAGEFRAALLGAGVASSNLLYPFPTGRTGETDTLSNTGAHSSPSTPDSQPSRSQPSISLPPVSHPPFSNPGIPTDPAKETRLAGSGSNFAASAPPVDFSQAKETRIGVAGKAASHAPHAAGSRTSPPPAGATPSASFFSKLNWKHYTAAGVAAALLLLIVVAVPVALLMNRSRKAREAAAAAPPVITQTVPEPTPQPTPEEQQSAAPPDTAQTFAEVPSADTRTPDATQAADDLSTAKRGAVAGAPITGDARRNKPVAARLSQEPTFSQSKQTASVKPDFESRKKVDNQRRPNKRDETLKALDQ